MEQMAQHEYVPWGDYVFLLRVFLVSAAPIMAGTWVAGRLGGRASAIRVAFAGLFVLVLLNWQVLLSTAPPALRVAFLSEFAIATGCAILGARQGGTRGGPTRG
jgi:hypothetical protein